jgi:chromosome segregation ATPase
MAPAHGEESAEGGSSTPLSLSAGSQINELQQRLKESERQREELSKQLQNADGERESAQLARLRQENQRLKLQLKEAQAGSLATLADRSAAVVRYRRRGSAIGPALRYLRQWCKSKTSTMAKLSES